MKKIIILFAVITFSVTKIIAQTEWAPIGAKWSNEYDNWEWNPPHKTFWTFTSVKDTLVNNKQCRKIIKNSNSFFLMYSENEKVYYSVNDTFWLLYDFSLKAGDTLIIPKLNPYIHEFNSSIKTKYIIDTIDSIKISGKILKRQNLHFIVDFDNKRDYHNYFDGYIIEKIGCISYMFGSPYITFDVWPDHLKCYQDSDIFYKGRSDFNCDGLDGISEIDKQNELQLYPNPALDKINIDCSIRQTLKMKLFNTFGQCVLQRELNNLTNSIDISSLTKGIYILKITRPNGTIEKKIIKE